MGSSIEHVKILAKVLGNLPLALAQACAYIKENNMLISEYLKLYAEVKNELLSDNTLPPGDRHEAVMVTWNITLKKMKVECPESVELMYSSVFFYNENIPELILDLVVNAGSQAELKLKCNKAKSTAKKYSMIKLDEDTKSFSMHCLVQESIKNWVLKQEKFDYLNKSIFILANYFKRSNIDHLNHEKNKLFVKHAISLTNFIENKEIKDLDLHIKMFALKNAISSYSEYVDSYEVRESLITACEDLMIKILNNFYHYKISLKELILEEINFNLNFDPVLLINMANTMKDRMKFNMFYLERSDQLKISEKLILKVKKILEMVKLQAPDFWKSKNYEEYKWHLYNMDYACYLYGAKRYEEVKNIYLHELSSENKDNTHKITFNSLLAKLYVDNYSNSNDLELAISYCESAINGSFEYKEYQRLHETLLIYGNVYLKKYELKYFDNGDAIFCLEHALNKFNLGLENVNKYKHRDMFSTKLYFSKAKVIYCLLCETYSKSLNDEFLFNKNMRKIIKCIIAYKKDLSYVFGGLNDACIRLRDEIKYFEDNLSNFLHENKIYNFNSLLALSEAKLIGAFGFNSASLKSDANTSNSTEKSKDQEINEVVVAGVASIAKKQ